MIGFHETRKADLWKYPNGSTDLFTTSTTLFSVVLTTFAIILKRTKHSFLHLW